MTAESAEGRKMREAGATRPTRPDVILPGRSMRAKFLVGFAISGLLPLLFLVYLGMPSILPNVVTTAFVQGGAFFVTLVFLVSVLQLVGFYVIYMDVINRLRATLRQEVEQFESGSERLEMIVEELRAANVRLREMSHTDELTEVGNRRNFDMRLREEMSRSTRFGHAFSLLMIDIDAFKRFNDEFGHPRGDTALRALGALMRSVSREGDVPCRVGGEEFAFILPETGKADATTFAERFRRGVEGAITAPDGSYSLTVSVGLAAFPEDGKTPEEIVWAADSALYESKRAGRNRVTAHARKENPAVAG
jgi:diguanylate cyclase (GGDEF)-like protein